MNTSSQLPAPKYTPELKIGFDFLYYLSVLAMVVGAGFILVVGLSIPAEISERHTDIEYLFNARVITNDVTAAASEIMQVDGKLKLNNTRGQAAFFIANTDRILISGIFSLLAFYNLRKLFANLATQRIFDLENVAYVKKLGLIILVYSIVSPFITYLCGMAILAEIGEFHEQLQLSPYVSIPIEGFLISGALLVLAQILEYAFQMKQEQSLTI
ncbi:MAG: DUF2975 domain-containing protein [Alteromonadaceae bacterium TMED7]|nr:MAG: DUF2975 domain-containing protein [Alteromonadaceae bacterium TMED7]|tara:strand:- start:11915 stop:12556 length:642 start_codon:yes stop_codon:yes gene_type:complete